MNRRHTSLVPFESSHSALSNGTKLVFLRFISPEMLLIVAPFWYDLIVRSPLHAIHTPGIKRLSRTVKCGDPRADVNFRNVFNACVFFDILLRNPCSRDLDFQDRHEKHEAVFVDRGECGHGLCPPHQETSV